MSMDLNRLHIFLEAARAKNYTVAGARLNLSQSAVSHAIRKLETSIGRSLVTWRGKQFSLTDDGVHLLEVCERVFRDLQGAEQELLSGDAGKMRRIVLGAPVEFGTTVLVQKMGPLLERHPDLHIDYQFSHHLLEPLLHGEVDLIIDCVDHKQPSLERIDLFREKYVIIGSPKLHATLTIDTPRDLQDVAVLSMDKEGRWWDRVRRSLSPGQRPALRRIVCINHIRGIIHAAASGLGVGLVPKYTVLTELAHGTLVDLFPDLALLEDVFRIYQKRSLADGEANRQVTEYLIGLDPGDYGDSIGVVRGKPTQR